MSPTLFSQTISQSFPYATQVQIIKWRSNEEIFLCTLSVFHHPWEMTFRLFFTFTYSSWIYNSRPRTNIVSSSMPKWCHSYLLNPPAWTNSIFLWTMLKGHLPWIRYVDRLMTFCHHYITDALYFQLDLRIAHNICICSQLTTLSVGFQIFIEWITQLTEIPCVNFMCQLHWATEYPDICSDIIPGVPVRVFVSGWD